MLPFLPSHCHGNMRPLHMGPICRLSLTFASTYFIWKAMLEGEEVGGAGLRPGSSCFLGTAGPVTLPQVDSGSWSLEAFSITQEHLELHGTVPSRYALNVYF